MSPAEVMALFGDGGVDITNIFSEFGQQQPQQSPQQPQQPVPPDMRGSSSRDASLHRSFSQNPSGVVVTP